MDLRDDDFRKAWPHALARAMGLVGELAQELGRAQLSADSSREELVALAERIPTWIDDAAKRLEQSADIQISRIEATHSALLDTQAAGLKQFQAEREYLERQRKDLDARILESFREQAKAKQMMDQVKGERDAFNNLGLWARIFKSI